MTSNSSGADVARHLLNRASQQNGETTDLFGAADEIFRRLHADLSRWFGVEGYEALVARTIDRARMAHPSLRDAIVDARSESALVAMVGSLQSVELADAEEGLVVLLGTFINLLGRLVGDDMAIRLIMQGWPDNGQRERRVTR